MWLWLWLWFALCEAAAYVGVELRQVVALLRLVSVPLQVIGWLLPQLFQM